VCIDDIKNEGVPEELVNVVPLSVMSWDIEVSTRTGKFDDNGGDPENRIICICYTIGDPCSLKSPAVSVCIVTESCNTSKLVGENGERIEIVVVRDELDMILTFAKHIRDRDPTFITGFNDSYFDLPFIKKKLHMYGDRYIKTFSDILNCSDSEDVPEQYRANATNYLNN
jgi:DNA polymerase elongation subunit (family B)